MRITTVGHGARRLDEFLETLRAADVSTLIDVRRFPSSRRHPHFNRPPLAAAVEATGIAYRHEVELGGRRSGEPGEERFTCIGTPAFRSYAARMASAAWQEALERALGEPSPCFMCAETPWWRCHRRLIAELLHARGHDVVHLLAPRRRDPHRPWDVADARGGTLFLCGEPVA